jgi:hypothetical protein
VPGSPFEGPLPAWGLELEDGTRCQLVLGAHDHVGDGLEDEEIIDCSCPGSDVRLFRGIDRSAPVWRARAATVVDGRIECLPGWVWITTAWFGSPAF